MKGPVYELRMKSRSAPSVRLVGGRRGDVDRLGRSDVTVDCGWGRLIFGHTFSSPSSVVETLRKERPGRRDIALYLKDPHVVLSLAPQELFLDPSHTYRLWLTTYRAGRIQPRGFQVRRLQRRSDGEAIDRILKKCRMVGVDPGFIWKQRDSGVLSYAVAEDPASGQVLGTVTGIDHAEAFGDPENGSSLWCLAVDPQAGFPGVGRALVAWLADHFAARGRAWMDLSVMHDNREAIGLYEDLGFRRVPVFCVKRKNPINEVLFTGPQPDVSLNPYAQIIVDEARRRGIGVAVLDAENGYFELSCGGRSIVCRESLSELTTAVAMSRCDNKVVTQRILRKAGLSVPEQRIAGDTAGDRAFLEQYGRIVVKPARGEQGRGINVNVADAGELAQSIGEARRVDSTVILEQQAEGQDLRIIVIDGEVVAAAVRRPAEVIGNGVDTVETLIRKQSRRREAATRGESTIPIDETTRRCVARRGHALGDVLGEGETLRVRDTANLHTGGTIHDVTGRLHPELQRAASAAARALDIPVTGLDFIVPDVEGDEYCIIEANERPGLANHEPQPTAQRFVDLLFPQTRQVQHG
jgi:GNAT-family acetyltransferase (TIGR03103 family)